MHATHTFCKLQSSTSINIPNAGLEPKNCTTSAASAGIPGVSMNLTSRMASRSGARLLGAMAGRSWVMAASSWSPVVCTASSAEAVPVDKLPPLPYAADALEPYIDTMTMEIHHDRHHQTYVTKLQTALDQASDLKGKSLEDLNKAVGTGDIPDSVMTIVRNNGGGHWNHSFFWKVLAPANSNEANYQAAASDELKKGIEDGWGSLKDFQTKFNEAATAVFGSGWAWLGLDSSGKLVISTTCNQDNPLMTAIVKDANTPVLGLDVWEHAYYLKYQNKRPDYLNSWWNVVNWEQVSQNLELAEIGKSPATA